MNTIIIDIVGTEWASELVRADHTDQSRVVVYAR